MKNALRAFVKIGIDALRDLDSYSAPLTEILRILSRYLAFIFAAVKVRVGSKRATQRSSEASIANSQTSVYK